MKDPSKNKAPLLEELETLRQELAEARAQVEALRGTEEALRLSEEKFYKAFHASPDIIVLTSLADGRLVEVNESLERATGYTHAEILGKTTAELQFWADPAERDRYVELLQRDGRVRDLEVGFRIKSGEIRDTLLSGEMIELQDGQYILGVIRDITERQRAQEEIRRRAGELAALNALGQRVSQSLSLEEVTGGAVAEIVRAVQPDLAFLFLREGERLLLKGVAPAGGQDLFDGVPEHRVGECLCGLAVREGQFLYSRNIFADARCTWEECKKAGLRSFAALPLRSGDEILGVVGLAAEAERDFEPQAQFLETLASQVATGLRNALLHERVQQHAAELEQRVAERTAQLQAANEELGSFSYSVSHDLRAPLRAVSGFAEIVARRHRAGLNEEGQHYVDNIVQASERMGRLIDDLLHYSRLGRQGVRREPVSLREVCAALARDLAERLAEIGGTLEIADDLPTVRGDRTLLSQILTNLLENALTYRRPDVPARVAVTGQTEGQEVILRVCDHGLGIAPEYHEKIFNVFQRLHSEEEYPGTGIGLATVKKAVELLGGRVGVESEVGVGSTFWVRLPQE